MKLTITKLKAAWPSGAKVGDVVELPEVPAWAVGKCEPAPDDAEVTAVFPKVEEISGGGLPSVEAVEIRIEQANRAAAEALQLADEARTALADAETALTASKAEGDELRKKLADAEAALTAAQSKKK
jgi:hypothetical protein